jgi:hypothetical protein
MKFRFTAVAALVAASSSHALTPAQIDAARASGTLNEVYVAGASSQRLSIGAWFQAQCNPSTFDVFFDGEGARPPGNNHRAYSCNLKKKVGNWVAGTPVLLVKRDQGGSFQGVNPVAAGTAQDIMVVDGTCTPTGEASPTTDILVPTFACSNVDERVVDAGVSDVEPALFQKPAHLPAPRTAVDLRPLDAKAMYQTILGVAVNKKLYRALQAEQGLAQDDAVANMPSLPRTFIATALSGHLAGGEADKRGWNLVLPSEAGAAQKQVHVCRPAIGAEAGYSVDFLNAGCGVGPAAGYTPIGQIAGPGNSTPLAPATSPAETGTLWWNLGSGSGDVEICLGATVEGLAGNAYAIGFLSRENSPRPLGFGTDRGYRFVAVDRQSPIRDNARWGRYGLIFGATMQWHKLLLTDVDIKSFLVTLRANIGKAAQLDVVDVDVQQGVLTEPQSYSGPYDDLTDPVTLKFASRVARNTAGSCSPLRMVK